MSNIDDVFGDMLDNSSPPPKKDKPSFFRKRGISPKPVEEAKPKRSWRRKPEQEVVEEPVEEDLQEEEWTRFSSEMLTENEVIEEVEDVVERPEREIGTRIKNEITINEAKNLDLSFRERLQLTQMYMNSGQEELRQLDEMSKQEEIRVNHVVTLRDFLMTDLTARLFDVNCELVVEIDAKFGPYIDEVISELELSYFCREIPRNSDLVNLQSNLPYRYAFMIRAI